MTNQQDAGEEEWTREPTSGALGYLIIGGDHAIGICPSAEVADQIIADHAAARRARKLEEELTEAKATIRRQLIWAQVGMKGKAEDDQHNADLLVATNDTVGTLEERVRELEALIRSAADGCLVAGLHSNPILGMRAYSDATFPLLALLSPAAGKEEA